MAILYPSDVSSAIAVITSPTFNGLRWLMEETGGNEGAWEERGERLAGFCGGTRSPLNSR